MVRKFKYDLQNKIGGKTGAVERFLGGPQDTRWQNWYKNAKF
jgi:hypothetical protein